MSWVASQICAAAHARVSGVLRRFTIYAFGLCSGLGCRFGRAVPPLPIADCGLRIADFEGIGWSSLGLGGGVRVVFRFFRFFGARYQILQTNQYIFHTGPV